MKRIINGTLLILFLSIGITSCNYLDILPDETATEKDAFSNPNAAKGYMYSCYSYLPNPREGASSLDLFTGDEVVTAFEHEVFAKFPKGNYTANSPVISYWNTLFQGIKQCYILLNNVDNVPGIDAETVTDYKAQANFLIAYYHFLLLKCYGPIILVKEEPKVDTPPNEYLGRSSYDECVEWIASKFEESIKDLPATREDLRLGLATSTAAKGILSRMYLYAASPLFNGNPAYANFVNKDGSPMISTTFDPQKWIKAKKAAKEAIDAAEAVGCQLYTSQDASSYTSSLPEPADDIQRGLRFGLVDKNNKENIWIDARNEGAYSLQNKSRPYWSNASWNGVGLTLAMLDRFYTEKGLPVQEDPSFDYAGRFSVANFPSGDKNGEGASAKMNMGREPRFYAWVAFHGGYYECEGSAENNEANERWAYLKEYKRGINKKKLVTFFTKNGNCGVHDRTNNYSPAGNLNKKGVHPASTSKNGGSSITEYPWTLIRLGELYLNYAEACVETNDLAEAKVYLNKIRTRAGIPSVEDSWSGIATLDQNKLREIVRQERQIELFLEGHNFWDMRRWLLAEKYFNAKPKGFNQNGENINEFSRETELNIIRQFSAPTHYLLPIPYTEIQRNKNLVQNPGY
ncbi:RagB/SusD family nutrient uptake outer membrane protein [Ornithobacterium rhinotracheale]|uniref:RagB/SusD family nutrient uptake outer membrane protein n=1 Tax=Ornithobacterium rhinotracheale TaxID=28251 RepID=UPI00129CBC99|nr:RagB/SusD family nutrient uptake outer membrane protein [Ornithobacterium rhinotracheale]MRI62458.1 RagB/SusD family nutrient uptake outer membrane protein [Ornithobacterium rhinotracheale]MRJ10810.1 RagB/SusD family nutrient uptake outer membrane protein [Ornithobacterium rhinotracheale]